ncbi:hypothetical protein EUTSA_v10005313mg [Eutrema salsugineum]|uniref:MADS-box domain-containing protein n=1 Tax=Eutrema salsugineum TaxID=72664 RepID=V4KN16_EUTSA|nr:agamous-like MADS-box protein AGL75 [Eutrema salsugineum]ESQ31332.1 hypothetical protein EUTSA_v10005313mg [Eutrema salsugineum]
MRASSSSKSLAASSFANRLKTIFKKAYELSILCQIEVCVIYYGPNGELKTWPKEKEKVKAMAFRYKAVTKRKKSLNLQEFMEGKKENDEKNSKKKKTKRDSESVNGSKYPDWYPIFDHYSPNQLSRLILSLEQTLSKLQERLRFVEAQKQRNTNLVYQTWTPSSSLNQYHHHHQYQRQPLNPNQFSLYMYNHGDATLSQLPLSASSANQLINYQNHLMMQQQKLHGFDQNYIKNGNFQHSNTTQALLSVQEPHELMQQQELYGSHHQNMCMMMNDVSNSNVVQDPCLSRRVPDELVSDFQKKHYGDMVGSTSFCPELLSGFFCQKTADMRD